MNRRMLTPAQVETNKAVCLYTVFHKKTNSYLIYPIFTIVNANCTKITHSMRKLFIVSMK